MKFYDCKTAPSPRRVRVYLAEKGLELETVQVDLGSGEQFSEAFRKINPDCVVPVLELDDGRCISEVLAICSYLEELHPEPAMFGNTAEEHAAVLMWNAKAEQQGLSGMADAFRNSSKALMNNALPGPDSYQQIPELAERGRERVGKFFERLDDQLADNEYIAGDFYSLADITALALVDFAAWIKISVPEDARNLARWYAAVSGRPSASA
ncbi:MAG: glutathione S-transferase [Gammaproteobacteria bacterium]|nr:glutathione S-transferase [Gammaproteobacteria bacterium]MBU2677534.1 glutathione S-transferase [Gammaproteobacteria bacterium]NNC56411.1 glutathione S-transferase [Woeseiaceae bacterium]NNL51266.1 glutathione S-transferase [Woeseiaceae bacterium]